MRAQFSILFRWYATLFIILLFSSSFSPFSFQFFLSIFLPSHRSFLAGSPSDVYPLATYLPDYLVLGIGYSVLGTRYPVYSPTTTIGEHTAAERRHPEATAFVPFVLVHLLLLLQASWGILRLFVSVSRRSAWGQDTPRAHALYPLLFFFLLFLFLLLFLISSASSSSCYRFLVASLRESSSSYLSIRLLFEGP